MTIITTPEGRSPDQISPSRRALGLSLAGGTLFAAYAPAALARQAQPIHTPDHGLITQTISYRAPDGYDLHAYMARPEGDGPFPLVIVASEIFGVHEYIRDVCRRVAHQGYVAIAPAFFTRMADPAPLADMQAVMRIVAQAGYEQVMGDIGATLDWAAAQSFVDTTRSGITGFCWGGKVVWQAMARFPLKAGVAWYGRLAPAENASPEQQEAGQPWPFQLADRLNGPVLGLYGDQDNGIPNHSVAVMNAILAVSSNPSAMQSRVDLYEGAQHGFHADYRPMFKPDAAAAAQARMFSHFEKHLAPDPAPAG